MAKRQFGKLYPLIGTILYRNQVTVAAGGPYAGKSRFSLHLANCLSTGSPTIFGKMDPINVLYCSERDWDFNSEQLKTVGITEIPENFKFFCGPDIPKEQVTEFDCNSLSYIDKTLEDWHPDLAIFDTVPAFQMALNKGGGDQVNSYTFNRQQLLRFKRWATHHHCSVLALFHSPRQNAKTPYPDPFDRILGSTAILASSVAVLILERLDDERFQVHFRSHVSKLDAPTRVFNYSDMSEWEVPPVDVFLGPFETAVWALVPDTPIPYTQAVKQIAAELEKSENQVRNALISLIRKFKIAVSDEDPQKRLIKKVHPS